MSQGENAYLVLRGVFHVSPPALGGLSIDGELTFSNNACLKLTIEWIMHSTESRFVRYRWHPWFDREVWVHQARRDSRPGEPLVRCGLTPDLDARSSTD
jgi:hypothetical protein